MKNNKLVFIFLHVVLFSNLFAHEPLFGLGPHTIYEAGYTLESEFEEMKRIF